MATLTHTLDLAGLRLSPGAGRRLELTVPIETLELGGERYEARPAGVPVTIDVSRMTGGGYALKLAMSAALAGPCMRCLKDASPRVEVQAREIDVPGAGEEMSSPYVHEETLDLAAWAHDALALAAPVKVLCREDCAGLCPECAADLNEVERAGLQHSHERAPDTRWARLSELKLD
jgi:DUF177 domain-containing protein